MASQTDNPTSQRLHQKCGGKNVFPLLLPQLYILNIDNNKFNSAMIDNRYNSSWV